MGGGSGGHVTPAIAVINEIAKIRGNRTLTVRFVCDRAFEVQTRQIVASATVPIEVSVIAAGKLRRYKHFRFVDYLTTPSVIFKNIVDIAKTVTGTLQALWLLVRFRPDVVFAKGGYVCLPVGWAARLARVPVVIHDSDARPGLTNRLLAPFATTIATGYPRENYHYDPAKTIYTGVPVRDEGVQTDGNDVREHYGIAESTRLVVAFGGGLGSRSVNRAMCDGVDQFSRHAIAVILVAGKDHADEATETVRGHGQFTVEGFIAGGLGKLMKAADVVVTRASATALQELAEYKKPAIIIPARQLNDQNKNAEVFEAKQAVKVLTDDALEAGELPNAVVALVDDTDEQAQLSRNIASFARPAAAHDVAELVIGAVRGDGR